MDECLDLLDDDSCFEDDLLSLSLSRDRSLSLLRSLSRSRMLVLLPRSLSRLEDFLSFCLSLSLDEEDKDEDLLAEDDEWEEV